MFWSFAIQNPARQRYIENSLAESFDFSFYLYALTYTYTTAYTYLTYTYVSFHLNLEMRRFSEFDR